MTISLSLVCAKLALLNIKWSSKKHSCIVASCSTVIVHERLVKAEDLSCKYLNQHNSQKDDEKVCTLASLLLCPNHEKKLCWKIAQTWAKPDSNNDLFQLFNLNRNPFAWKCYAEHCNSTYEIKFNRALTIIEELTLYVLTKKCLKSAEKTELLTELSLLLHCKNHIKDICKLLYVKNEWNQKLIIMN